VREARGTNVAIIAAAAVSHLSNGRLAQPPHPYQPVKFIGPLVAQLRVLYLSGSAVCNRAGI
jgi:hypothetical protein